jgi:hypothetical protein
LQGNRLSPPSGEVNLDSSHATKQLAALADLKKNQTIMLPTLNLYTHSKLCFVGIALHLPTSRIGHQAAQAALTQPVSARPGKA